MGIFLKKYLHSKITFFKFAEYLIEKVIIKSGYQNLFTILLYK